MNDHRDRRYISYILESIALIEARTRGWRDAFLQDVDAQDAVLWRLEALAEATGNLSPEIKRRHRSISWRAIYPSRNIAAHGYLELRLDRVWEIVEGHLVGLRSVVERELERSSS